MASTTRSLTRRSTGGRLVGGVPGGAVAVVGITAVPVGTAMAAGIDRGPQHPADAARQATFAPGSPVLGPTTAATVALPATTGRGSSAPDAASEKPGLPCHPGCP